MANQSAQTTKFFSVLRILVLVSASVFQAYAADHCKTFRMEVPDPATLNLKDGEQVIAVIQTDDGRLEARVNVKGKVVSEPRFFLRGSPLVKVPESQVPESIRECLKSAPQAQNAALTTGGLLVSTATADPTLAPIAPVAYVKEPKCVVVMASCAKRLDGKYNCVARACCTSGGSTACEFASGVY